LGLVLAAAVLGAACNDDNDNGEPAAETPMETPMETPIETPMETPMASTVEVNLTEWTVAPDPESVAAGTVTFNAHNIGGEEHELVVFKTDLAPDALPANDDGSANEAGEGVELIGEIEEFASQTDASASFELAPGNYVLICNVVTQSETSANPVSHYANGMRTAFTVTG
jgi:hypothetical protein